MANKQINKDRRRILQGFGTVAATIALPQRLSAQTSNDTDILIIGGGICLLYTSPSPRDATLSRMPSSA